MLNVSAWATADGVWDLDKAQQDGTSVGFLLDTLMGGSYLRHLSKQTIDGKESRARDGYHNGNVSFGYMAPDYQSAPDGTRRRRMPVRPDPITFHALVRIGELTAQGWSDRAIADELEPYLSKTARFGERLLTKDTIAAIRRSAFPREFAPGCGHGTIVTPSNDLVEGRHQAAWPYELWQRMVEVKMQHFHRPTQQAQRHPHAFSQIIVCAACRRRLRFTLPNGVPYYKDTSKIRKLDCPLPEALSIKEATVLYQFGDLLRSINLPERWQETISAWVPQGNAEDRRAARLEQRRLELEAEQKRLVTAFAKGYLTEEDLDAQAAPLRAELFALPLRLAHNAVQETLNVGETLEEVASYWSEAAHEQRQEIVTGLLAGEGLIYDLERRAIVGLLPHASVLPVLTLGLQHTAQWEQRDGGLWLLQDSWPPKQDLTKRHIPPPPPPSLSPAQREEAVKLLREPGMSLRNVASRLGTLLLSRFE